MIRKILLTYALLFGFVILKLWSDGFTDMKAQNVLGAIIFVLVAGPLINMYWDERRKARERKRRENMQRNVGGKE